MNDNINELEKILNEKLLNDNYKSDYNLIKETITLVHALYNEENISEKIILKINDNINELNIKYIDLFDLTNLYDPLKYKLEQYLHNNYVSDLRKKNREERSKK